MLEKHIQEYLDMESPSEADTKLFDKYSQEHEDLITEKVYSAILRSKASWYKEGERNSKYFFNLEKARAGAKNMTKILRIMLR